MISDSTGLVVVNAAETYRLKVLTTVWIHLYRTQVTARWCSGSLSIIRQRSIDIVEPNRLTNCSVGSTPAPYCCNQGLAETCIEPDNHWKDLTPIQRENGQYRTARWSLKTTAEEVGAPKLTSLSRSQEW